MSAVSTCWTMSHATARNQTGETVSISEADAQLARREHRVGIQRHRLHASDRARQRNEVDRRRIERHHAAEASLCYGPNGRRAESKGQETIAGTRNAPSQFEFFSLRKGLVAASGHVVTFRTAVCILDPVGKTRYEHVDKTTVRFREFDRRLAEAYLRHDEPYDCAGSFKLEGAGFVLFESVRTDDPTALIGLPMIWLADRLLQLGYLLP